MKKLLLGTFVVLIVALGCGGNSTDQNKTSTKSKDTSITKEKSTSVHPHISPVCNSSGITLNGIACNAADVMVDRFVQDNMSSDKKTNIWLSRTWVNKIYDILTAEQTTVKADGIRLYFAKNANNRNTIIITSTKFGGTDPYSSTGNDHLDYFEHTDPFLSTVNAHVAEDYGTDPGAKLYNGANCSTEANCNINELNYISCIKAAAAVKKFGKSTVNTISEWFPLTVIENIKCNLDGAPSALMADGVRIYFAKKSKKIDRHSFLFVTTKTKGAGHEDFYECYCSSYKHGVTDNGEQCPTNCNGATWPQ